MAPPSIVVARRQASAPSRLLVITTLCFGWAFYTSTVSLLAPALDSPPLTDAALLRLIVIELAVATLAVGWLRRDGADLRPLVPLPSGPGVAIGIGLYGLTVLGHRWLISPLESAFPPQPIDAILAQAEVSLPMIAATALVNGSYEEIFLLGFLCRTLRPRGLWLAIGVSLAVRASYHLYQGPIGVLGVLLLGLVVTVYYVRTGSLFAPVVAHVAADVVPFL